MGWVNEYHWQPTYLITRWLWISLKRNLTFDSLPTKSDIIVIQSFLYQSRLSIFNTEKTCWIWPSRTTTVRFQIFPSWAHINFSSTNPLGVLWQHSRHSNWPRNNRAQIAGYSLGIKFQYMFILGSVIWMLDWSHNESVKLTLRWWSWCLTRPWSSWVCFHPFLYKSDITWHHTKQICHFLPFKMMTLEGKCC